MEARRIYAFTALQIFGVGVLLWMLVTWNTPWNAMRYIGTVLAVVGISFIALARYQLGMSFAVKAEAHALVTRGLYSKIRNPIYVFGVVMVIGIVLVVQRQVLWIVVGVMVIGQTIRARREARVLETAFGDAYREYRSRTWF
jgi:protein-S-isoprenylcysteine O-methyltransferase Ste14